MSDPKITEKQIIEGIALGAQRSIENEYAPPFMALEFSIRAGVRQAITENVAVLQEAIAALSVHQLKWKLGGTAELPGLYFWVEDSQSFDTPKMFNLIYKTGHANTATYWKADTQITPRAGWWAGPIQLPTKNNGGR